MTPDPSRGPAKIDPNSMSRMIGKAKVNTTASFSRKNIFVSTMPRDRPSFRAEGIARVAVVRLGAVPVAVSVTGGLDQLQIDVFERGTGDG
ncbi:hypothetical protein Misp02_41470 [Microtetraspora sp. NBRC 16547]|nr:hypothetical protein Misp02_41470 [Microtetraspora sp. NBRC 16547]